MKMFCVFVIATAVLLGAVKTPSEYDVKAAFLFNFTQFVEWPSESFSGEDAPIIIGILGPNPFGNTLEEIIRGENVNGRSLVVRYYNRVEDGLSPHVLFLSSNYENISGALAMLRGRPVLTVSDSSGFAEAGGVVAFLTMGNRIRLRVNLSTAKEANLKISSKLLRVAETIEK